MKLKLNALDLAEKYLKTVEKTRFVNYHNINDNYVSHVSGLFSHLVQFTSNYSNLNKLFALVKTLLK